MSWLPVLVQPANAPPPRRYDTRARLWYEDRAGRRYGLDELTSWGSEPVRSVIAAAAKAERLPRLTLTRAGAVSPNPRSSRQTRSRGGAPKG